MWFSLQRFTECNPQQALVLLHVPNWTSIQALILAYLTPSEGLRLLQSCIQLLIDRSDLFLEATAIRICYTGSAWTVPTPPLQVILPLVQPGQGGVWDFDSDFDSSSSRSLPVVSDAVEETNVDTI